MWGKYENDTLIHQHIMAKSYKKRYQRASDLNNTFYRIFGLVTVITSSVASTITWGSDIEEAQKETIKYITTISAISAAILNFYNFKDLSKEYTNTAKQYALLQNKIENIGNIHPDKREISPQSNFKLFKKSLILFQITEVKYQIVCLKFFMIKKVTEILI
jgi:hypothetical protein